MKKNIFTVCFFGLLLFLTAGFDLFKKDRFFSETENRILAAKPDFQIKELLEGSFGKDYEEYISDQFLLRDKWIMLKTYTDIGLQKKEINGVYYVPPDTLFEKHAGKRIEQQAEEARMKLKELADWCEGKYRLSVMLVPTADAVYKEKLPKFSPYFNQEVYLNQVKADLDHAIFVEVSEKLMEHRKESVFYRTDHHWTTLGAFYGYQAWREKMSEQTGENKSKTDLKDYRRKAVTKDFLGTLHGKINIPIEPDSIELFLPKKEQRNEIYYDFKKEAVFSFYEERFLKKKDKYSLFFGGNHDFIEIRTENKGKKNILVIKDSYANCFVPFLTEDYDNIYVVDFRYFRGNTEDIVKKYEVNDILVLYNVVQFAEEFRY